MGSRKRLATALAALALTAAACTNGDASGNQATEAMENAGVERETAVCIGNQLENQLTQDELNELADSGDIADLAGEPVAASDDDLPTVAREALENCFGSEGDGSDSEGDSSEDEEADTDTSDDGSEDEAGE